MLRGESLPGFSRVGAMAHPVLSGMAHVLLLTLLLPGVLRPIPGQDCAAMRRSKKQLEPLLKGVLSEGGALRLLASSHSALSADAWQ